MPETRLPTALRDAIRGAPLDVTEGNLGRAILLLSVPMVLEMALESLFGILDVFWVGRLGPAAVAAVGVTEAMVTLIFGVAIGLSMATTAMVARRIGEKDPEAAADAAGQAILLGLILSLGIGLPGAFFAPRLLGLMGAPAEVIEAGWSYTAWILGGNATIMLLFLINAIFRGAGDPAIAMRSLWLASGVNLILDPLLIFGLGPIPAMGITGAAIGTTIGRAAGVAYQLRALSGRAGTRVGATGRIVLGMRHLRPHATVMLRLARVSVGGTVQMLIATASYLGMVRLLTPFGAAALAGYTISLRLIVVAILPSWGLSNATATLVGQNLGAGKPDRAEQSVWVTGFWNMIFLGAVAIVFIAFAGPLVRIFSADPEVIAMGVACLRCVSYGYVFYAWGMVLVQAFNGAGDTMTPTWIFFFCYWLFQIPLAWVLSRPVGMGPAGVFWAIMIAESVLTVVGLLAFRRGRWKQKAI